MPTATARATSGGLVTVSLPIGTEYGRPYVYWIAGGWTALTTVPTEVYFLADSVNGDLSTTVIGAKAVTQTNGLHDGFDMVFPTGLPIGSLAPQDAQNYPLVTNANPIVGGTAGGGEASQAIGMSWTTSAGAPGTYQLDAFVVKMSKVGLPTDTVVATVRTTSHTGTLQATSSAISLANLPKDIGSAPDINTTFVFPTPFSTSAGVKYYIQFIRTGARDASNYANIWSQDGTIYAGGGVSVRQSNVWLTESSTDDLWFKAEQRSTDVTMAFNNTSPNPMDLTVGYVHQKF